MKTESFGETVVPRDPYELRLVTVVEMFGAAVIGALVIILIGGGWLS